MCNIKKTLVPTLLIEKQAVNILSNTVRRISICQTDTLNYLLEKHQTEIEEIKNLAKQLENAKFYLTVLIIKLLPAIFLNEDSGLFVDSRKNYYPITF